MSDNFADLRSQVTPNPIGSAILNAAQKCGPGEDCSAFTQNLQKNRGISVPRTAIQQYQASQRVSQADLQPGDHVFFDNNQRDAYNTNGKKADGGYVNHVGVYVGNGQFIADPGQKSDVRVPQDLNAYLQRTGFKFMGGGRFDPKGGSVPVDNFADLKDQAIPGSTPTAPTAGDNFADLKAQGAPDMKAAITQATGAAKSFSPGGPKSSLGGAIAGVAKTVNPTQGPEMPSPQGPQSPTVAAPVSGYLTGQVVKDAAVPPRQMDDAVRDFNYMQNPLGLGAPKPQTTPTNLVGQMQAEQTAKDVQSTNPNFVGSDAQAQQAYGLNPRERQLANPDRNKQTYMDFFKAGGDAIGTVLAKAGASLSGQGDNSVFVDAIKPYADQAGQFVASVFQQPLDMAGAAGYTSQHPAEVLHDLPSYAAKFSVAIDPLAGTAADAWLNPLHGLQSFLSPEERNALENQTPAERFGRALNLAATAFGAWHALKGAGMKLSDFMDRTSKGTAENMATGRFKTVEDAFKATVDNLKVDQSPSPEIQAANTMTDQLGLKPGQVKMRDGKPVATLTKADVSKGLPNAPETPGNLRPGQEPHGTTPVVPPELTPTLVPPHEGVAPVNGPLVPPTDNATGLARQFADKEAQAAGIEPTPTEGFNVKQMAEQGKKDVESGKIDPVKVLDEVSAGRDPTREEIPALTHYKQTLRNESRSLQTEMNTGVDPARALAIDKRQDAIADELGRVEQAAQKARTIFHGYGQALQTAFNEDFSPAELTARARAANHGETPSAGQTKAIDQRATNIATLGGDMATERTQVFNDLNQSANGGAKLNKPETVIQRINKLTGGQANKTGVTGGRSTGTRSGAIDIGSLGQSEAKRLASDVRALAKHYISEEGDVSGAHLKTTARMTGEMGTTPPTIQAMFDKFHRDLPHLSEDNILSLLSDKYKKAFQASEAEKMLARAQLQKIRQAAQFRDMDFAHKAGTMAAQTLNGSSRGAKLAFHFSAPFTQGRHMLFENTGAWLKGWKTSVQGLIGGDKAAYNQLARFKSDPLWNKAEAAGMDQVLAKPHGTATQMEESIAADLSSRIPGFNKILEHSGATFNGFLNEVRWQAFKDAARLAPQDKAYLADMAHQIAESTGRSISKAGLSKGASSAANVIFAPRYTISKWEYATGKAFRDATTPLAKQQIALRYARVAAGYTTIAYTLHKTLGAQVDLNPRSSEFGHMTIGKNVIDLFGAEAEPFKLIFQTFRGKVMPKAGGQKPEEGNPGLGPLADYAAGKLTPAVKLPLQATGVLPQYNADGTTNNPLIGKQSPNKRKFSLGQAVSDLAEPITIQSSREAASQGANLAPYLNPLGIMVRAKRK